MPAKASRCFPATPSPGSYKLCHESARLPCCVVRDETEDEVTKTQCPCAGTSDLVGQMVGALVSTALVFEDTDAAYYDRLMTQALSLYGAGMRRRGKYSDVFLYDCAPRVRARPRNGTPAGQHGSSVLPGHLQWSTTAMTSGATGKALITCMSTPPDLLSFCIKCMVCAGPHGGTARPGDAGMPAARPAVRWQHGVLVQLHVLPRRPRLGRVLDVPRHARPGADLKLT